MDRKRIVYIFLSLLIFHYSLIIPQIKYNCICQIFPEKINCCCNCPYCVAKRGGFKTYCHIHIHKRIIKVNPDEIYLNDSCSCRGFAVIDDKDKFVNVGIDLNLIRELKYLLKINYKLAKLPPRVASEKIPP